MNKQIVEGIVKFHKIHEFKRKDRTTKMPLLDQYGNEVIILKCNFVLDIFVGVGGKKEGFPCSTWDRDIMNNIKDGDFVRLESYMPRCDSSPSKDVPNAYDRYYNLLVKSLLKRKIPENLKVSDEGGFTEENDEKATDINWSLNDIETKTTPVQAPVLPPIINNINKLRGHITPARVPSMPQITDVPDTSKITESFNKYEQAKTQAQAQAEADELDWINEIEKQIGE